MPKRKPPTEKRIWARIVNGEWRVNLVSGEVLTSVRVLATEEAVRLTSSRPVYYFGFLIPVRELTGDAISIASELALTADEVDGPEYNQPILFRGDCGTEAVVLLHHH